MYANKAIHADQNNVLVHHLRSVIRVTMSGAITRVAKRVTDLAELMKRVRPENRPQFDAFSAKCQQYIK